MGEGKILLLGLGMQGKVALYDLARSRAVSEIVVVDKALRAEDLDVSSAEGGPRIRGVCLDASDEEALLPLMRDADVVVELLPGRMAFPVAKLAVTAGANLVSSMYFSDPGEEDPAKVEARLAEIAELDVEAREKGLVVLSEFGMDPGIDLVLAARAIRDLDEVHELYSYGAGFPEPEAAGNPLRYKFTWSVEGLLRSYRRPARVLREGRVVEIPATEMFSEANMHILDLPEVGGKLECFPNGDALKYADLLGIRDTVVSMGRFICRWPGHGAFWEKMAKCGFLDEMPVRIRDFEVTPLEFMVALLGGQPQFSYAAGERDVALIRVDARGVLGGRRARVVYQLVDRRDLETGFTAMSRTVGFTVGTGAEMILRGEIPKRGLVLPVDVPYEPFVRELGNRGLHILRSMTVEG